MDRPIRGTTYFALEAASLFMVAKTQAKLSAARKGQPGGDRDGLVESRVRQREDWIVLSIFWALLSGVDAWVSAHMYDFQEQIVPPDDEARIEIGPAGDGTAGVRVAVRIPLGLR